MPVIRLPGPLRRHAGDQAKVEVEAATVGEALDALVEAHPELREHVFDEDGELQRFVNFFIGDQDVKELDGRDTEVSGDDTILVLPAVAGGDGPSLNNHEMRFYGRHLILPQVGLEGQRKLKAGSVLVVGAGGLGCPALQYLAAAGVGRIGIVDDDEVEASNLHRQVLYGHKDVGRPKAEVAAEKLRDQNPHIEVEVHRTRLTSDNAKDIIADYDVVIDGTDNFPTRYLVNDACVMLDKPNIYSSIFRFEGQASVFWPGEGPCYRCLYPQPPPPGMVPSCAEGGVLGVLPGILGVIQATEAVKVLLKQGSTLAGRLVLYDALEMSFETLRIKRDPDCPVCSDDPEVTELIDYEQFCGIDGTEDEVDAITVDQLAERLDNGKKPPLVIDVREAFERDIVKLDLAKHIPLANVPEAAKDLPLDQEIVVYCHTGARSAQAVKFLRDLGFSRAKNLEGGIDAWAQRVETDLPRY